MAAEGAAKPVAGADKPPSTVKLTSFCLYRATFAAGGKAQTVHGLQGVANARIREDGHIELVAASVPFRSDAFIGAAPRPGAGMLMLYGIRDSIEELYRWRNYARQNNLQFVHADFEVEVGHIEPGVASKEVLRAMGEKMRFLNLRRMSANLQAQVMRTMQKYDPAITKVVQIAQHPELFDVVLSQDPDFKHIDVMVIPVADDPESPNLIRQVAYVRAGAKVIRVHQGSDQATIYLASWMSDVKEAKKLLKSMATEQG